MPTYLIVHGLNFKITHEVIQLLLNEDCQIKLIVSQQDSLLHKEIYPFETHICDFDSPKSYSRLLQGVDKIFYHPPSSLKSLDAVRFFLEHAKKADVKHIVMTGGFSNLSLISDFQKHIKAAKKNIDLSQIPAITNIHYHFLMQFFLVFKPKDKSEYVHLPFGEGQYPMVDVRDVALVAVKCLKENGHEGETYRLTGKQFFNCREVIIKISQLINRPLNYKQVPDWIFKKEIEQFDLSSLLLDYYISVIQELNKEDQSRKTDTIAELLGKEPYTVDEFILHHQDEIRKNYL